ncbi:MAG: MFS transporter [Chloroflexi bacterium]|nr:MFS transporter [Chloroflexota bacterium]
MGRRSRLINRESLARRTPFFYGWVIVYAAGSSMFVRNAAASLTLAVFIYPMAQDLGWSRALIAGAASAAGIAAMFISPVTGWLLDRFGPRALLGLSVLVLGFTSIGLAWATVPIAFYLLYGIGRIIFSSPVQIGAATVVSQWFVKRRGRTTAILGVVHSMGMGLIPLYAQFIMNLFDGNWRPAWIAIGILVWVIALVPVWLLLIRRPEDVGMVPDAKTGEEAARIKVSTKRTTSDAEPWSLKEAMRTPVFWVLALVGGLMFFVHAGVNTHQAAFLRDRGISATAAAGALTALAAGTAIGSMAWGLLTERLPVRFVYAAVAAWIGLVALVFLLVDSIGMAYLAALLFGFGLGGLLVVPPVILADYFGRKSLGSIRGATEPFVSFAQALGAVGAGLVWDITKSYDGVFPAFTAVAGVAFLLLLLARAPARPTPATVAVASTAG